MQILGSIVNGPKSNNYILVSIWIIVCIQKRIHHFCRSFSHYACLRLCSSDSSPYPIVFIMSSKIVFIVCMSAKGDQRKR